MLMEKHSKNESHASVVATSSIFYSLVVLIIDRGVFGIEFDMMETLPQGTEGFHRS
jgi:hypothetical protein